MENTELMALKNKVVAEIQRTSFGVVVNTDHPAAWWTTSFAGVLRDRQSDVLSDLLKRVEAVFDKLEA